MERDKILEDRIRVPVEGDDTEGVKIEVYRPVNELKILFYAFLHLIKTVKDIRDYARLNRKRYEYYAEAWREKNARRAD